MFIKTTLGELLEIHEANYDDNGKANSILVEIITKLNGDRLAVIPPTMPEFQDYCDAID